jgi:hypothetical protein
MHAPPPPAPPAPPAADLRARHFSFGNARLALVRAGRCGASSLERVGRVDARWALVRAGRCGASSLERVGRVVAWPAQLARLGHVGASAGGAGCFKCPSLQRQGGVVGGRGMARRGMWPASQPQSQDRFEHRARGARGVARRRPGAGPCQQAAGGELRGARAAGPCVARVLQESRAKKLMAGERAVNALGGCVHQGAPNRAARRLRSRSGTRSRLQRAGGWGGAGEPAAGCTGASAAPAKRGWGWGRGPGVAGGTAFPKVAAWDCVRAMVSRVRVRPGAWPLLPLAVIGQGQVSAPE